MRGLTYATTYSNTRNKTLDNFDIRSTNCVEDACTYNVLASRIPFAPMPKLV